MSQSKGGPSTPPSTPTDSDPSVNEALRRARASFSGMSDTDVDAHLVGNYFRQPAEPTTLKPINQVYPRAKRQVLANRGH